MKIYISASFAAQKRLRPIRDQLWAMGHQVVSTWLDEAARPTGMPQTDFERKLAIKDVAEIFSADLLIGDRAQPSTTGGTDREIGIAIGRHQSIMIWLVGTAPASCPFDQLADRWFPTWDECLEALRG